MTKHSAAIAILLSVFLPAALSFASDDFQTVARKFLQERCSQCHSEQQSKGDFRIASLSYDLTDPAMAVVWQDVVDLVSRGEMPPESEPRPVAREIKSFVGVIEAKLRKSAEQASVQSIRKLRRLSHSALDHTVHDLLGTRLNLAQDLPSDVEVAGFDNLAETLGQSSEFVAILQKNAQRIAANLIETGDDPRQTLNFEISDIRPGDRVERVGDELVFWGSKNRANTAWPETFVAPRTGIYRIAFDACQFDNRDQFDRPYADLNWLGRISPFQLKAMKERIPERRSRQVAVMALKAPIRNSIGESTGGRRVGITEISATMATLSVEVELEAGENFILYAIDCPRLQNPPRALIDGKKALVGEQMYLRRIQVEGPLLDQWPPALTAQLLNVDGRLSTDGLDTLLRRAFRGPVDRGTEALYLQMDAIARSGGDTPVEAARVIVESVLCSPRFLYHALPVQTETDFAFANRLSYFLWNSMPDEELMRLAETSQLGQPKVTAEQVRRMIADPKSDRFVEDFTGQWLGLRRVGAMPPDPDLYAEYDYALEVAMRDESESLFREILRNNEPITAFLAPNYAMLNERLAQHYGIDGVTGREIRRVTLPPNSPRGGLLGHASILTITSNGTTTSPVVRGVWVLENLLDSPPPPPPPDVEPIEPDIRGATTIREMLAKHRDIATCQECHRRIDPWGFGLENFDAIGAWREQYGVDGEGKAVDATGSVFGGTAFDGAVEMRDVLLQKRELFLKALTTKLVMHATGYTLSPKEEFVIDDLVSSHLASGKGFADLIVDLCNSSLLRERP